MIIHSGNHISVIWAIMLLSFKEQNFIHFLFSYNRVLSSIRNDSLVYLALFSIFLDSLSEMKQTFLKNNWYIQQKCQAFI